jgi:hypothetical protein
MACNPHRGTAVLVLGLVALAAPACGPGGTELGATPPPRESAEPHVSSGLDDADAGPLEEVEQAPDPGGSLDEVEQVPLPVTTSGFGPGVNWGTRSDPYGKSGPDPTAKLRKVNPTVHIGDAVVTGGLDTKIIGRYIRRNLPKIKYCYEKQLLLDQDLEGTVVADFVIDQNGMVTSSSASGVIAVLSTCIADVIGAIQFPEPKGGGVVEVRYPFSFRSGAEP